jgi:hypothetical protein
VRHVGTKPDTLDAIVDRLRVVISVRQHACSIDLLNGPGKMEIDVLNRLIEMLLIGLGTYDLLVRLDRDVVEWTRDKRSARWLGSRCWSMGSVHGVCGSIEMFNGRVVHSTPFNISIVPNRSVR